MSWNYQNYLNNGGDHYDYIMYSEKPEPLSEQNRRILILEAIGEFDEELCRAVKQKVEQRLEQLSKKKEEK